MRRTGTHKRIPQRVNASLGFCLPEFPSSAQKNALCLDDSILASIIPERTNERKEYEEHDEHRTYSRNPDIRRKRWDAPKFLVTSQPRRVPRVPRIPSPGFTASPAPPR